MFVVMCSEFISCISVCITFGNLLNNMYEFHKMMYKTVSFLPLEILGILDNARMCLHFQDFLLNAAGFGFGFGSSDGVA